MEIPEIKAHLTLAQVLHYYHLKPDKQLRLCYPFYEDKTPSMQIYYKTHTAYCFSSNCPAHGKSLDVIDFVMYKEGCSKHEAILKAGQMSTGTVKNQKPITELPRITVLTKIFTYFKNGVHNSKPTQEYLQQRGLAYNKTEVSYNSGQFHHGARKDTYPIESCVQYGLLLDLEAKSRTATRPINLLASGVSSLLCATGKTKL